MEAATTNERDDMRTHPRGTRLQPRRAAATLLLPLALVAGACSNGADEPAGNSLPATIDTIEETDRGYRVEIDPADFVDEVDNPYFPLEPGTKWVLEGETDEGREVDTIEVLDETKEVMGVTTTVVLDQVTINGELAEKTWDWYAQDEQRNVWYFGENTAEYEDGNKASSAGAWEAGVDGALPGIIMVADPQVNDSFRQEFYEGEAEDMFWVVATGVTKDTPYEKFDNAVRTIEWTPLEPKVVVEKYHVPGIGLVAEKALAGGKEIFELVSLERP